MAKKKKYPKRPKASASLSVWENYKKRRAEVDKHIKQVEADEKKKKAIIGSCK